MTLVFDTSALSELLRDNDRIVRAVNSGNYTVFMVPLATDAELRYGFAYGSKQADNLAHYKDFKQQFSMEIIVPNQDTSIIYADLAAYCRKNGLSLSNNDFWIAAATVQHGAKLLTTDNDFASLPQVSLAKV